MAISKLGAKAAFLVHQDKHQSFTSQDGTMAKAGSIFANMKQVDSIIGSVKGPESPKEKAKWQLQTVINAYRSNDVAKLKNLQKFYQIKKGVFYWTLRVGAVRVKLSGTGSWNMIEAPVFAKVAGSNDYERAANVLEQACVEIDAGTWDKQLNDAGARFSEQIASAQKARSKK